MRLCVFEDREVASLEPLILSRPAFDLRCGSRTLLERQTDHFNPDAVTLLVRPYLEEVARESHPDAAVRHWNLPEDADVLVNARWLPPAGWFRHGGGPRVGLVGDQVAYVVGPPANSEQTGSLADRLDDWREQLPTEDAGGAMIDYPWDLVEHNADALRDDAAYWARHLPAGCTRPGVAVVGRADRVFLAADAHLDPHVVIDTTNGPVIVDSQARIEAFSRLTGPCYVGPGTWVLGARVTHSTLGPHCRVGGEVEATIFQGYANKAHDGFLGHSWVGEWVNLAAGTQVSDLRNDYANVTMTVNGEKIDTGLMKIGSFIGDHTKTGVNTLLNTGSVIGAYCSLLPSASYMPRTVPSFCEFRHNRLRARNDWRQLLATTAAVKARRQRASTDADTALLHTIYDLTAFHREAVLTRHEQTRARQAAESLSAQM